MKLKRLAITLISTCSIQMINMRRFISWFLPSNYSIAMFIKKHLPATYSYILRSGEEKEYKRAADSRKQIENASFLYNHEIGSPIIAVPNEHDDLVIGFVVAHETITQANTPIAIVYDYVRDKELMLLPKAYPYLESFARTVSDLHPADRHILFYGHEKAFSSINESTIIGWKSMQKRLQETGFFEKLNEHISANKGNAENEEQIS